MATAQATADAAPAAPEAVKTEAAPKPKRKMKFRNKLLLIVTSLALMALLRTGFMFVVVALMPAIITYYMDRSPRMYMFKTIFACNLSGTLPFIGHALHDGPAVIQQHIIGSAGTWIIIYGSAFAGYLLVSTAPVLAQFIIGNFHTAQIARLERAQKNIENEWGNEVVEFSRGDRH